MRGLWRIVDLPNATSCLARSAILAVNADDGGLWRLNGSFTNASLDCDTRGLTGADLTDCHCLTQSQLDAAHGDLDTKIPTSLSRPAHWAAVTPRL